MFRSQNKGLASKKPAILNELLIASVLIRKLASKYKPIVCALKNYNFNSREKFEPGSRDPRFKSRSRFEFKKIRNLKMSGRSNLLFRSQTSPFYYINKK